MKKYQSVRGMRDILPNESKAFRSLEDKLISSASQYGFQEIKTPILEDTNLFIKSIGGGTDIVEKEMYSFIDSKNNSISMRPEGTASCARALIENGLNDTINKIWYSGPFFRHERPQKGRYRQFHQFGIEFIGVENFEADFEIISLANNMWRNLKINPTLIINSIGDSDDRKKYINVLVEYLKKYEHSFNENEKNKLKLNPLRILDTKNIKTLEILEQAPKINEYISKESKTHFENLLRLLEDNNIEYTKEEKLVRGLDYYNRTVFEYIGSSGNTQNAICAGGRYDFLFENLCDKKLPALGFAIGIERLIEYAKYEEKDDRTKSFYIITLSEKDHLYSLKIANLIRNISKKFIVSSSYSYKNIKSQLKKADKLSSDYCVIIGQEERKNNTCQLKNMNSGDQKNISIDAIEKYIRNKICIKE